MEVLELARRHAQALLDVDGVVGVALGGSHARGVARPDSDVDLGVAYRGAVDVAGLRRVARELTGRDAEIAAPGGWGPWVDGGAWLDDAGTAVDWILRDVDRVAAEVARALHGERAVHHQAGHPFGFVTAAYVGELALCVLLADPTGELAALRARVAPYPEPLRAAFRSWLWEAGFLLEIAGKSARRGDAVHVGLCTTHAVGIMAHALHAHEGRWVVNEKGLVDEAAALACAPQGFSARAAATQAGGTKPEGLAARLDVAEELLAEVRMAVSALD